MKKCNHSCFLLLPAFLIMLSGFLYGCSDEFAEEPAVYAPSEIRRLLLGEDGAKVWRQSSEYYLEDSCRTGYLLRFRENVSKDKALPFMADFYRDTTACMAGDTLLLNRLAIAKKHPEFRTTDTLLLINIPADTSLLPDTTVHLIRLLTSQQLIVEVPQAGGESIHLEYQAVPEEVEEEEEE